MAKIRSIHPVACTSEKLARSSAAAERCYWRLQTHCDDAGRCEDHPRLIWAALFPLHEDVSPEDVAEWLAELANVGLVHRYVVGGKRVLEIGDWDTYQHPNRPRPSRFPARTMQEQCDDSGEALLGQGDESAGVVMDNVKPPVRPYASEFADWWVAYPRKVGRGDAFKAFQARRRDGVALERLTNARDEYAKAKAGCEQRFLKHGSSFLAKDGPWSEWENGPPEGETSSPPMAEPPPGYSFAGGFDPFRVIVTAPCPHGICNGSGNVLSEATGEFLGRCKCVGGKIAAVPA